MEYGSRGDEVLSTSYLEYRMSIRMAGADSNETGGSWEIGRS
jgi:hypothetical protein